MEAINKCTLGNSTSKLKPKPLTALEQFALAYKALCLASPINFRELFSSLSVRSGCRVSASLVKQRLCGQPVREVAHGSIVG